MSGRSLLSENTPPSPSRNEHQRLLARLIENQKRITEGIERSEENQKLVIKGLERSEERHRESLLQLEERTVEIINAQGALFSVKLETVRQEALGRIEAVEGQVQEIQQTLTHQQSRGSSNVPDEPVMTVGQLEFVHRNMDGTRDRYVVSYDQVIKQGKIRGVCPFCTNDYSHNYLKSHIVNICFKNSPLYSNSNIPSNCNNL